MYIITWGLETPIACKSIERTAEIILEAMTDNGYYETRWTIKRIAAELEDCFEADDYGWFEGYDGEAIRVYEVEVEG